MALRGVDAGQPAWQPLAGRDAAAAKPLVERWTTLCRLVEADRPAEALAQIDALALAYPALAPLCSWQRMLLQDALQSGSTRSA